MKNSLITLLILFISISLKAQQIDKLYTPGGGLYPTFSPDGIGINETKPEAALHINQSDDKGTGLQIDLEQRLNPDHTYSQPAYGLKINRFLSTDPDYIFPILSVDFNANTRIGYFNANTGHEKLMVNNSIGIYKSTSTNSIRLGYKSGTSQPQLKWNSTTSKNFQFKNSSTGAVPISLSPDGKVGINTDNFLGDHSLYIEGSSIAEEMFVKLQGQWGDYVFKDDYLLRPLSELENFIAANGHLPEMPTAEEVEEEGVKTGETIRLLTVKVEELTLYILQQQKEIDALKEKLVKVNSDESK